MDTARLGRRIFPSSTQGGDNARCTRIVLPWATVFNAFSVPIASHSLADHTEMCRTTRALPQATVVQAFGQTPLVE